MPELPTSPQIRRWSDGNPNYRHNPKTDRFCWHCQCDMREGSGYTVHLATDNWMSLIHPDDATPENSEPVLMGPECAKRVPHAFLTPSRKPDA